MVKKELKIILFDGLHTPFAGYHLILIQSPFIGEAIGSQNDRSKVPHSACVGRIVQTSVSLVVELQLLTLELEQPRWPA